MEPNHHIRGIWITESEKRKPRCATFLWYARLTIVHEIVALARRCGVSGRCVGDIGINELRFCTASQ